MVRLARVWPMTYWSSFSAIERGVGMFTEEAVPVLRRFFSLVMMS